MTTTDDSWLLLLIVVAWRVMTTEDNIDLLFTADDILWAADDSYRWNK